jgi:hypothetical protein
VRGLVVCAVVALAGCGGSQTPGASVQPDVVVEAVGDEPWSVVRYALARGYQQHFEVTLKVRATTTFTNTVLEEGKRALDLPGVVVRMRAAVTAVTPEGDADLTYEVEGARVLDDVVDPSLRAAEERDALAVRGLKATARLSANGALSNVRSASGTSSDATRRWMTEIESAIQSSDASFPDAPIGVGAVWRVTSNPTLRDVHWTRVATYTLRARTESTVDIDAVIEMTAVSQALRTEPNASLRLTSATSKSSVHARLALAKVAGDVSTTATAELRYLIVRRHERLGSKLQIDSITSTASRDDIAP